MLHNKVIDPRELVNVINYDKLCTDTKKYCDNMPAQLETDMKAMQ